MVDQTLINWIIGGAGALLGIMLKALLDSVKDLQKADTELTKRVGEIEVLVAGRYVLREDMDRSIAALFSKLDKIDAKLDSKMDKPR